MPRLETPRLVLRPPEYSDAPAMAAQFNDFDVVKNTCSYAFPYSEEAARSFVSQVAMSRAKGEGFVFSVLLAETGAYIGSVGLVLEDGVFDLGYMFGKAFWNQGYATEAGRKIISFAFNALKADEITAGWFADNPASGQVLKKLGFVTNGTRAVHSKARDALVTTNMMRLTRMAYGQTRAVQKRAEAKTLCGTCVPV